MKYKKIRQLVEKYAGVSVMRSVHRQRLDELTPYSYVNDIHKGTAGLIKNSEHQLIVSSKSELGQDYFAALAHQFSENGFFVEFGAADGVGHSNSFALEKVLGWDGLLAEPVRRYESSLRENRSADLCTKCVAARSGERVTFYEREVATLSSVDQNIDSLLDEKLNKIVNNYDVDTISLEDMLDEYNAPKVIQYMSIDTEGSEYDLLAAFNFDSYQINTLTVEHNFSKTRQKITKLLENNGFLRIPMPESYYDDFYINSRCLMV